MNVCHIFTYLDTTQSRSLSEPYECIGKKPVYKKLQGITTRNDKNILRPDSESLDRVLFEKFNYLSDSLN